MPPELAAGLLDALHQARAAARPPDRPQLDGLIGAFAAGRRPPRQAIVLSAPRAVLREMVLVAVDEAGETLARRCTSLLREAGSTADVHAALARLGGLLELLDRVDAAGGSAR